VRLSIRKWPRPSATTPRVVPWIPTRAPATGAPRSSTTVPATAADCCWETLGGLDGARAAVRTGSCLRTNAACPFATNSTSTSVSRRTSVRAAATVMFSALRCTSRPKGTTVVLYMSSSPVCLVIAVKASPSVAPSTSSEMRWRNAGVRRTSRRTGVVDDAEASRKRGLRIARSSRSDCPSNAEFGGNIITRMESDRRRIDPRMRSPAVKGVSAECHLECQGRRRRE
jgi:hypothetical protein